MEGTRYHSGTTKWTAKLAFCQPAANLVCFSRVWGGNITRSMSQSHISSFSSKHLMMYEVFYDELMAF